MGGYYYYIIGIRAERQNITLEFISCMNVDSSVPKQRNTQQCNSFVKVRSWKKNKTISNLINLVLVND